MGGWKEGMIDVRQNEWFLDGMDGMDERKYWQDGWMDVWMEGWAYDHSIETMHPIFPFYPLLLAILWAEILNQQ